MQEDGTFGAICNDQAVLISILGPINGEVSTQPVGAWRHAGVPIHGLIAEAGSRLDQYALMQCFLVVRATAVFYASP